MLASPSILCLVFSLLLSFYFFFFTNPATTEIYTLSLHDALPIYARRVRDHVLDEPTRQLLRQRGDGSVFLVVEERDGDRKSTRLNSSHVAISYAVFCLKKKKKKKKSKNKSKKNIKNHKLNTEDTA